MWCAMREPVTVTFTGSASGWGPVDVGGLADNFP